MQLRKGDFGSRINLMDSLSTPEHVFRTAANDFRAGLSEEQRADFQVYNDPSEMIKGLQDHFKKHSEGKRSRLLAGYRKIDTFCKRVEPYFKVIDILVSSHPEYAGIVWGAVRLVFLVRGSRSSTLRYD